jgi:hypothetical protein
MNKFLIIPGDDFIWNRHDLIQFLINNQDKDIVLDLNNEGCSSGKIGLYELLDSFKFKSVTILTCNLLECHNKYNIKILAGAYTYLQVREVDYTKLHYWNEDKVFGVFYNRALWHRIGISSFLMHYYSDKTFFNFRANPHNEDSRKLFELQKLFNFDIESAKNFINIIDKFPNQVELIDGYTVHATTKEHTNQVAKYYPSFLIDIVAETFTSGDSLYITEKTIRPMLLKKPFIIMGSKNFMIYLRQMGFKTFYEYWNEDYDGFDDKERYQRILQVINAIAKKNKSNLEDMYNSMQDILEHNYNLLVTQSYNKDVKYVR